MNNSQLDSFIKDDSSYRRIVAGPGTGKTYTLKKLIRFLLEKGVEPQKILLLTFTRMAAKDIQNELFNSGIQDVERIKTGTLHSFCLEMLAKSEYLNSINRKDRILFIHERDFLIEDLSFDDPYNENKSQSKNRLKGLEAGWAREQNQTPGWPTAMEDKNFLQRLNRWLLFHDGLMLEELIPLAVDFIKFNPEMLKSFHFEYILVDEYQDLNKAEQHFVDLLSSDSKLVIVGDEDQSIYEDLRYARPEGILTFDANHSGTLDLILEKCRRCPPNLVVLANELITHNEKRSKKNLLPDEQNPEGDIQIIQFAEISDEISSVADFIELKVKSGEFNKEDIIVLTPIKELGYLLKEELQQRDIISRTFFSNEFIQGNPKKIEESRIHQSLSLLQLFLNRNDKVALRCWLGYGYDDLRKKQYKRLMNYCEQNNTNPFDTLHEIVSGDISIRYIDSLIDKFNDLNSKLNDLDTLDFPEQLEYIFPISEPWTSPVHDLVLETTESLQDIFKRIQQILIRPELPSDVDFIRIMSLYKSKGLTAEHVIIIGCIQGLIPKAKKDFESSDAEERFIEEQRRLFYVALTRARRTLVLTYSSFVSLQLAHRYDVVIGHKNAENCLTYCSSYIKELGPHVDRYLKSNLE